MLYIFSSIKVIHLNAYYDNTFKIISLRSVRQYLDTSTGSYCKYKVICMYKPRRTGHSFLGKIGLDEFCAFFKSKFAMNGSNIHFTYILFQCCFLEEKVFSYIKIPKNFARLVYILFNRNESKGKFLLVNVMIFFYQYLFVCF